MKYLWHKRKALQHLYQHLEDHAHDLRFQRSSKTTLYLGEQNLTLLELKTAQWLNMLLICPNPMGNMSNFTMKPLFQTSKYYSYAIVRKEPPPRPPAPIRRRKSTRSLDEQRPYNTLPNYHSVSPMRPSRNYSTISPSRPPRARAMALEEQQM